MGANRTPIYSWHAENGALISDFAGWEMPIHYGSIIEEARHTRSGCSLFDICHMGEFFIKEPEGSDTFDAAVTNSILKMKEGRCRYGFLLNEDGTVADDLIIYRLSPRRWMVVVNAGNIGRDSELIRSRLGKTAVFEDRSSATAKLDLQGPLSMDVLASFAGEGVRNLTYFSFGEFTINGQNCLVSRTGYTGELGFEIYIDAAQALSLWELLLSHDSVKPAGLGARDILRIEAGLPLYGDELSETVTPVDAGMEKFIDFSKEFIGKNTLELHMERGSEKVLCGLSVDGRRTPRHGMTVYSGDDAVGEVTSGCFSPHTGCGIGFAYIKKQFAHTGTGVVVGQERTMMNAEITAYPFIRSRVLSV